MANPDCAWEIGKEIAFVVTYFLQCFEPFHQFRVFPPFVFSTAYLRRSGSRWLTRLQSSLLHPEVDLCVTVGRFQADMSQPAADYVYLHTGFEEVYGGRMAAMLLAA